MLRPFDLIFWHSRYRLWRTGFHQAAVSVQGQSCRFWMGGRGATVLLIHGIGGSTLQDFRGLAGRLALNHRVISMDLPGFGCSRDIHLRQSVTNQARFLLEFLDALGIEKTHVLGNSMGGWIALKLGRLAPGRVRKLVLTAAAGIQFTPPPLEIFTPDSEADIRRLLSHLLHRPRVMPGWFARDWLRVSRERRAAVREMLASMQTGDDLLDDQLAALQIPTLILWGRHDRLIPLDVGQRLAGGLPHARLEILENCGHLVLHEDLPSILRHVLPWLKE